MLLELGDVDPNIVDSRGETPLLMASEGGHEGIVRLLLECNGVNHNLPGDGGQTPLLLATENGHEGIMMLLLERQQLNHLSRNTSGQAPLPGVACHSYEGIVKLLPEWLSANSKTPAPTFSDNTPSGDDGNLKRKSHTVDDNTMNPPNISPQKRPRYLN